MSTLIISHEGAEESYTNIISSTLPLISLQNPHKAWFVPDTLTHVLQLVSLSTANLPSSV